MPTKVQPRRVRRLTIILSAAEADRLEALAAAEERDLYQQARYLIVRQLGQSERDSERAAAEVA